MTALGNNAHIFARPARRDQLKWRFEFIEDAPDDDEPRLGAWLELRAQDPASLFQSAIDAGLKQVKHPGHLYYFMAPGGQVFTIASAD